MNLATILDAVPLVQSTADRTAKFPTPLQDQRVYNKGTGNTERFDQGAWKVDIGGAQAALGWFNPKDAAFNAKGDGASDDVAPLQAMLAAIPVGGGTVSFPGPATYVSSGPLVIPAGTTVYLNGSTLRFTTAGSVNNVDLRSGTSVLNGTVLNVGSGGTGAFQAPITIGDYGSGVGYNNIQLCSLAIITNTRPGSTGIFITGDSYNITIDRITMPATTQMLSGITCHWGGATTPSAGTTHPHGIRIQNVDIGDMGYTDVNNTSPLFLSAVYNISVRNLKAGDVTNSKGLYIYPGDYGAQYATAEVQRSFMRNIRLDNYAVKSSLVGATVTTQNISGTVSLWPADIVINGLSVKSNLTTSAASLGLDLSACDGLQVLNSVIDGFNVNVAFAGTVNRVKLERNKIKNSYATALNTGTTSTPNFNDIALVENEFTANNQQASAGRGDVVLNNSFRWTLRRNTFNSPLMAFAVRALNTSVTLWLYDNHTVALAGGGTAYSIGSGGDYSINATGRNNTAAAGIALQGGAPIFVVDDNGLRTFTGTAAPVSGAWNVGDRVMLAAPTAGGPKSFVCVAAGTPGTWRAEPYAPVVVLVSAPTILVDASLGSALEVTLDFNRIMGAATNPTNGQRLHWTIIQDGTGGRTLNFLTNYPKLTWSDAGNTPNKRSTIAAIYDGTNWNQDGAQTPYI